MRRFVFLQGASNKFWEVAVSGAHVTVTWGRIGTAGQSKTKALQDDVVAQAAADKLIAEKQAKGYTEEVAGAPGAAPAALPAPPAPAAAATEAPAASPARPVPRRPPIELHPHEWAWATWRPLPASPGLPRPFDAAACAAAIRRGARSIDSGWRWSWRALPFTGPSAL